MSRAIDRLVLPAHREPLVLDQLGHLVDQLGLAAVERRGVVVRRADAAVAGDSHGAHRARVPLGGGGEVAEVGEDLLQRGVDLDGAADLHDGPSVGRGCQVAGDPALVVVVPVAATDHACPRLARRANPEVAQHRRGDPGAGDQRALDRGGVPVVAGEVGVLARPSAAGAARAAPAGTAARAGCRGGSAAPTRCASVLQSSPRCRRTSASVASGARSSTTVASIRWRPCGA